MIRSTCCKTEVTAVLAAVLGARAALFNILKVITELLGALAAEADVFAATKKRCKALATAIDASAAAMGPGLARLALPTMTT